MAKFILALSLQILSIVIIVVPFSSALLINEFVVDPQTDWDSSGTVGSSDEWIELFNEGGSPIDLTDWFLVLNDSTPENESLTGTINAGDYFVILDPEGLQNNDGQILLYNPSSTLVDSVSYGNWNDSTPEDNAPDGNSEDYLDECLARIPNGQDTGIDINDFVKTECTYGTENRVIQANEQNLQAIIGSVVVFNVLPRWLNFGLVQPGTNNNPALNGPITFDVNGSSSDVNVEITNVTGSPFDTGLKIDGVSALGKTWTIPYLSPIQTATPTLDVPPDVEQGSKEGTIIYTVTGLPPP